MIFAAVFEIAPAPGRWRPESLIAAARAFFRSRWIRTRKIPEYDTLGELAHRTQADSRRSPTALGAPGLRTLAGISIDRVRRG